MAAAQVRQLEDNCAEFGIPLHGIGSPSQGIVHVIGPAAGPDPARDDDRLRRLAHQHARRVRRARVRDRHQRGRDGARDPDAAPARPEDLRGPRRRPARPGRQRQGHHPEPDLADRGRRRHRARLRVPRRRHPGADHGTAHDHLQHEHRGRRARRADRPGRHDLRVPPRPAATRRRAPAWDAAVAGWRTLPSDDGAVFDKTDQHRRERPRADGHLRHEPGHGHPHHQPRPVARRPGRPGPAPRARARARVHGPAAPARRSSARRSTSSSSGAAPTAASATCASPPRSSRTGTSRPACG